MSPDAPQNKPTAEHTKLKCFAAIARHHGVDLSIDRLLHDNAITEKEPSVRQLVDIAKTNHFKADSSKLNWEELPNIGAALPIIAFIAGERAVVISGFRGEGNEGEVVILDPLADKPGFIYLKREQFCSKWSGDVMLLKREVSL
jgi:ATP-binding cassette, subfamily B, bacterial HlyB/CyaB